MRPWLWRLILDSRYTIEQYAYLGIVFPFASDVLSIARNLLALEHWRLSQLINLLTECTNFFDCFYVSCRCRKRWNAVHFRIRTNTSTRFPPSIEFHCFPCVTTTVLCTSGYRPNGTKRKEKHQQKVKTEDGLRLIAFAVVAIATKPEKN